MTVAILTAAGIGSRMKSAVPKQFLVVRGRPVLAYTLAAFQACRAVDFILVATRPEWFRRIESIAAKGGVDKFMGCSEGGDSGQESIHNALKHLAGRIAMDSTVIIHDGNRPMVDDEILEDALRVAKEKGNAIAAIPCAEVVFRLSAACAQEIPREELVRTQTPHVFALERILASYSKGEQLGLRGMAASCQLLSRLNEPVYFSRGKETNLKLTTQDDLRIFEAMLERQERT